MTRIFYSQEQKFIGRFRFFQTQFGLDADTAGYMSTLFDLFGFAGALFAGFVSDRVFQGRRTMISILMFSGK